MKLYEIDQEIQKIFDSMVIDEETGEVSLDTESLEALQEQRQNKLEGAALYVKDLEAMAKAIREEEKALAKRRQAMESKAGRIREWIIFNLGDDKIETARVKISTRKGVDSAKVDDADQITSWLVDNFVKGGWESLSEDEREEFNHVHGLLDPKRQPTLYSKPGIKKLFEEGYQIEGAHIEAGKPSLQIK
ncbi:MAG: siphovirus Gp157 family protein [Bacteroidales bacterium]|nr:siphovirus Gp157 family protein [Bacteroidales bacterium]